MASSAPAADAPPPQSEGNPAPAATTDARDVSAWAAEDVDDDHVTGHASRPSSPPAPAPASPEPLTTTTGKTTRTAHFDDGLAQNGKTSRKRPTPAAEKAIRRARALARTAEVPSWWGETSKQRRRAHAATTAATPPPKFSASAPVAGGTAGSDPRLPPIDRRFAASLTGPVPGWARMLERKQRTEMADSDAHASLSPLRNARTRLEFVEVLRSEAAKVRDDALAVRVRTTRAAKVAKTVTHEEAAARQSLACAERTAFNAVYRVFAEETLVLKTVESGKLSSVAAAGGRIPLGGSEFLKSRSLDAFKPSPTCADNISRAATSVYAGASRAAAGPTVSLLQRASYSHPLPPGSTVDVLPPMLPYKARLCTVREGIERGAIADVEADARSCMVHNFHSVSAIFRELDEIGQVRQHHQLHQQHHPRRGHAAAAAQPSDHDDASPTPPRRRRQTLLRVANKRASVAPLTLGASSVMVPPADESGDPTATADGVTAETNLATAQSTPPPQSTAEDTNHAANGAAAQAPGQPTQASSKIVLGPMSDEAARAITLRPGVTVDEALHVAPADPVLARDADATVANAAKSVSAAEAGEAEAPSPRVCRWVRSGSIPPVAAGDNGGGTAATPEILLRVNAAHSGLHTMSFDVAIANGSLTNPNCASGAQIMIEIAPSDSPLPAHVTGPVTVALEISVAPAAPPTTATSPPTDASSVAAASKKHRRGDPTNGQKKKTKKALPAPTTAVVLEPNARLTFTFADAQGVVATTKEDPQEPVVFVRLAPVPLPPGGGAPSSSAWQAVRIPQLS